MRHLTLSFLEFRRRWLAMPTRMRAVASLMFAAAFILCVLVWAQSMRQKREWLLAGQAFSSRELARIEGAFASAGLSRYDIKGGRVQIPRAQRTEYVNAIMADQALPDRLLTQMPTSSAGSFLENSSQRQTRMRRELEQKLKMSVLRMRGIEDATVHLDEATTGTGFKRENRVTAMVAVTPTGQGLSPRLVRSIRELVAGAKVELSPSNVTVTDLASGNAWAGSSEQDDFLKRMDEYRLRKSQYEQEWNEKLCGLLQFIPGVQVTTNVELVRSPPEPNPDVVNHYVWPRSLSASAVSVSVSVPGDYYQHVAHQRKQAGQPVGTTEELKVETRETIEALVEQLLPQKRKGMPVSRLSVVTLENLSMQAALQASRGNRFHASAPGSSSGTASVGQEWSDVAGSSFRGESPNSGSGLLSSGSFLLLVLAALGFGLFAIFGFGKETRRPVASVSSADREGTRQDRSTAEAVLQNSRLGEGSISSENYESQADENDSEYQTGVEPEEHSPSVVHEEITHIVRENPTAAATLLQEWLDKAA